MIANPKTRITVKAVDSLCLPARRTFEVFSDVLELLSGMIFIKGILLCEGIGYSNVVFNNMR